MSRPPLCPPSSGETQHNLQPGLTSHTTKWTLASPATKVYLCFTCYLSGPSPHTLPKWSLVSHTTKVDPQPTCYQSGPSIQTLHRWTLASHATKVDPRLTHYQSVCGPPPHTLPKWIVTSHTTKVYPRLTHYQSGPSHLVLAVSTANAVVTLDPSVFRRSSQFPLVIEVRIGKLWNPSFSSSCFFNF